MSTNVSILVFMGRINFMLSQIEHEKSFITSVPEISISHKRLYILTEAIYINRTNFTFTFGIIRTNDFLYCIKKFQTQKCGRIIQMMFIFVLLIYISIQNIILKCKDVEAIALRCSASQKQDYIVKTS